jgi:hypothetical protein
MKKLIPFLVALILPVYAFGDDHLIPAWEASCKCDGYAFKLNFSSLSGDPTEDDMIVKYISSKGNKMIIPVQKALYSRRSVVSDVDNICNDIGGFKLNDNKVLLWLSRNNRPDWDELSLVLIDLKNQKVLDIKEDIGPIKDAGGNQKLAIRKKGNGYEVRLERGWLKNTETDSAENSIEDWMYIQVINNKITNNWSKKGS